MLGTIEQLREVARRCKEGQPLPGELSAWLGAALEAFLAHNVATLDEALGICNLRGGVPWWREAANRRRDSALRTLAETWLPDLSLTARANRIVLLANRYACGPWRFDRDRVDMPENYRGSSAEQLWLAFKSGAPMPIGERHLRTILSSGKRSAPANEGIAAARPPRGDGWRTAGIATPPG
jgi:hypothetical protein